MGKTAANSKADTAVKLVLVFFISLLSFSVGTFVGKAVSDSDYRRAALESDYNEDKTVADAGDEISTEEAAKPATDEEVASLTDEYVKAERGVASEGHGKTSDKTAETNAKAEGHDKHATADHKDGHGTAKGHGDHAEKKTTSDGYTHHSKMKGDSAEKSMTAVHGDGHGKADAHATKADAKAKTAAHEPAKEHTMPAAAKKSLAEHPTTSSAADRVAKDLTPAADQKPVRQPTGTLPTAVATSSVGKYTVQVASYATETEAKDFASKLTNKGYSAFYVPAEINGKTWYRVSVGLFADQKSATNYRTELLSTQAVSSAIVQKIVK